MRWTLLEGWIIAGPPGDWAYNAGTPCGCSSVDRVLASEAKGRGFDPRQPHHLTAMQDEERNQLRAMVRAHSDADKVSEDKRLKSEILLLRSHARIVEDKPGHLVCEGDFGRAVAEQKEATLYDAQTQKPLRWQPYKSHLFAAHSALCWAVLGISVG